MNAVGWFYSGACVCVCGHVRWRKTRGNLGRKERTDLGGVLSNSPAAVPGKPDLYAPALTHPSVPTAFSPVAYIHVYLYSNTSDSRNTCTCKLSVATFIQANR